MTDDVHTNAPSDDEATREQTFARRALLRAGWVVPAVIVLDATPAFAMGSTPPHTDIPGVPHTDTVGGHTDVAEHTVQVPHTDIPPVHNDSIGTNHVDLPGVGAGGSHVDFMNEFPISYWNPHVDQPPHPQDVPHEDVDGVHTDTPAIPHTDT